MEVSEINNYVESFVAYLDGETISSYKFNVTSGIEILSSSNTDTEVSYSIRALVSNAVAQKVIISIATSLGRIEIRTINFEITGTGLVCTSDNNADVAIASCALAG